MFFYIIPFVLIIAADQLTKFFVARSYGVGEGFTFIPGVLNITYVENRGAAFGILEGKKVFLTVIAAAVFVLVIWYIFRYKPKSRWLLWALTLVIAGGAGNFIDRIWFGYVRDFLEVAFTRFPVFNVADCAVTAGALMLALHILIEEHRRGEDDFDSDSGCPQ